MDVVQARLRDGSKPGKRQDSHKVGLVVEGGGMRGVVTGAALQAMHDLGMRCVSASCNPSQLLCTPTAWPLQSDLMGHRAIRILQAVVNVGCCL